MPSENEGLTPRQAVLKRAFDIAVSASGLVLFGWLILLCAAIARLDTGESGFFTQQRIGRHGRPFRVIKLRTMKSDPEHRSHVTTASDARITATGRILRRFKLDELPQLVNVLKGEMSLVGPRPDVPGFADRLAGGDRLMLSVRPGITGPATLKYRNEETLLAQQADPEAYNRDVLFPDKVRINCDYVRNWSFPGDLAYIWRTVFGADA